MNSRRLARLMSLICDIRAHSRRTPQELCQRFGISRRQLYKDRDTLAEMGFGFHFSRRRGGFLLDKEPMYSVSGLSLADLFALILAVRELTRRSDFGLALGALEGLRTVVGQLPAEIAPAFLDALDQVVVADGFGCDPEVFADMLAALRDRQRVVLWLEGAGAQSRVTVDPRRLLLRQGGLFVEAMGLDEGKSGLLALSRVRRVMPLPLFSSP